MPSPGDVVVVDFPGAQGVKRRPAVVLSSAAYHAERPDVILGVLTSNLTAATPTSDHVLQDWKSVGLNQPSAFRAFVQTVAARDVHVIGKLAPNDWTEVQRRLRTALG